MIKRDDLERINQLIEEHDQLLALAREPLGHGYPESVVLKINREVRTILDTRRMQIVDELKTLYCIDIKE